MSDGSAEGCSSTPSRNDVPDGQAAGQRDLHQGNATKLQYPYYEDGPLRKVHPYK